MLSGESSIIIRHADKGSWPINEENLRKNLPDDDANLILSVLKNEFSNLTETPLKLDGLKRSIRLGDQLFEHLPDRTVLISINSGKDRAKITNSIATGRIAQRETQYNNTHDDNKKQIDVLQIESEEITSLLADTDDITWPPYAQMIKEEGIDEFEALARWLNDMNTGEPEIPGHPHEAAVRYQKLITSLKDKITSEQVPVVIFGVGHSGSLGQVAYESGTEPATAEDIPNFCEMFIFNAEGKLLEREKVDL